MNSGDNHGPGCRMTDMVTTHQKGRETWYRGDAWHEDARGGSGVLTSVSVIVVGLPPHPTHPTVRLHPSALHRRREIRASTDKHPAPTIRRKRDPSSIEK